jgi:beta-glucosidase
MGWPITPQGIGDLLVRWTREYGPKLPQLFITENGAAFDDGPNDAGEVLDHRRVDYLRDHIASVERAIERGANIGGYYVWSLLDNFEWALGYEKRFGIVHVDYLTQVRTPKASAKWFSQLISNNAIPGKAGA